MAQPRIDMLARKLFRSNADTPKAIKDEFTDLPFSRQYKYQLRMQRDRRCVICGEPAVGSGFCLEHLVKQREREEKNWSEKAFKGSAQLQVGAGNGIGPETAFEEVTGINFFVSGLFF